ncbi:hypothetical protein PCE31106_04431 [Pandoraea cepalis]|uniref:Uncharacterized protein n=1 Tax=Pandoraea cepalis TaxID=2508294 RepID=A0A5E4YEK4_9BURK|nr:hypothetical protein [Pandoraea cepalis]VVE46775.1 hypothetical protein PCE31106_04431 [Pandoraea cepalis]
MTGISVASKTLPPAYAAIIGVMLFAMITLLLTLWRLWSARQDLRRVPSR